MRASATENADLFWAIRGGGGNFGVATLFEYQLHPVGPQVMAGLSVYPFDHAKTLLTTYSAFVDSLPDDVTIWAVMRKAPPLPFLPPDVHGKDVVALAFCSTRAPDEVMRMTDALRHAAPSCGEHLGAMPYAAWQKAFDPLLTPGARNYWKSHNFNALSDGAIDAIIEFAGKLPTEQSEIFLGLLGGQANRMPVEATAYPHRNVMYAMNVHTRWTDPAQDTACIAWAREFFSAAMPYAAGSVYINFLTEEEGVRIADAYGPNYQRLAELKGKYDPANLFRKNQNIKPSL